MGRRRRIRYLAAGLTVAALAAAALLASRPHGGDVPASAALEQDSLRVRFAVLSKAHSNRCGMPASALDLMRGDRRLQGSCCFPMNYRAYVHQIRALRRYASVDVIPEDPYDIPVSLAKRLVSYKAIELTPAQTRVYKQAIPLSKTRGPCCCPCWRWTAFEGQAKYLITQRHYNARQIGEIWTLEDGCGGPSDA